MQSSRGGSYEIDEEDLVKVRNSRLLINSESDMKEKDDEENNIEKTQNDKEQEEVNRIRKKPLKRTNSLYEALERETRDVDEMLAEKMEELKVLRRKNSQHERRHSAG